MATNAHVKWPAARMTYSRHFVFLAHRHALTVCTAAFPLQRVVSARLVQTSLYTNHRKSLGNISGIWRIRQPSAWLAIQGYAPSVVRLLL